MKELLSQYTPKITYYENNLVTALRNHIVSLEKEKFYFLKRNGNKKPAHFYSDLSATINVKTISLERPKS